MRKARLWVPAIVAAMMVFGVGLRAQAQLIESWDNTTNGWVSSPFGSANQQANFSVQGNSATTGVTNGATSLVVGATATNAGNGPDYSQLLISPAQNTPYGLNVTNILSNASDLKVDFFAPPGSFGFFLQVDIDINNSATGFKSLDNFNYQNANIGGEITFTVPIDAATRAQLAGSGTGTQIIFQVGGGYSANNETMYIDNLRATAAPVPEPATLGLLATGAMLLLRRR